MAAGRNKDYKAASRDGNEQINESSFALPNPRVEALKRSEPSKALRSLSKSDGLFLLLYIL